MDKSVLNNLHKYQNVNKIMKFGLCLLAISIVSAILSVYFGTNILSHEYSTPGDINFAIVIISIGGTILSAIFVIAIIFVAICLCESSQSSDKQKDNKDVNGENTELNGQNNEV